METVTIRSVRDVIDFVNSRSMTSRRTKILVFLALGAIFVDAYDLTSLGIGVDSLREELSLTPFQVGSVTAIMALGALVGALVGGVLTDKFGRFKMFIVNLIFLVFGAIGAALSPNLAWLLVFRFFLGFGVGMDMPLALSFIAEFTNSRIRGKTVNLWQPVWYVATVCTGLAVLPLLFAGIEENLWRYAVGFGAIPALIILGLRLIYIDESPAWAAQNQGLHEAAKILERNYQVRINVSPTDSQAEERTARSDHRTPGSDRTRLAAIFSPHLRARTVLASIISGTQSMEYYAVGFYLPSIVALIFGEGALYAVLGAIALNLFGILGGGTQYFVTQRFGVWRLAFIGYCIAAASLILVGLTQESISAYLGALLIGIFIFGHSFGPGAQGKTMAALSYPTNIRATGTGWAETMSRVGTILGFYVFPLVLSVVGLSYTLLLLAAVPLTGLLALVLIRWEPIGQDTEEVPGDSTLAAQAATNT